MPLPYSPSVPEARHSMSQPNVAITSGSGTKLATGRTSITLAGTSSDVSAKYGRRGNSPLNVPIVEDPLWSPLAAFRLDPDTRRSDRVAERVAEDPRRHLGADVVVAEISLL